MIAIMPKISIIIPIYNVEEYLRECLNSVLAQTMKVFEVIAVNDGSSDHCDEILERYKHLFYEQNIPYQVITQPNGGLSVARNTGVSYSKGEYLYFLDSDDTLKSFAIEKMISAIESSSEAEIFYFDAFVSPNGSWRGKLSQSAYPLMPMTHFFEHFYLYEKGVYIEPGVPKNLFKHSWWIKNNISFLPGIRYEDLLLLYRISTMSVKVQLVHLQEPFYVYRDQRVGSITTSVSIDSLKDRQQVCRLGYQYMRDAGIKNKYFSHSFYFAYTSNFWEAYYAGLLCRHNLFFTFKDWCIMYSGCLSEKERNLCLLALINPKTLMNYCEGKCADKVRKRIERIFTIFNIVLKDSAQNE